MIDSTHCYELQSQYHIPQRKSMVCSDPHPREGTETIKFSILNYSDIVGVLTLIPARGRKLCRNNVIITILGKCSDPHPREGTETGRRGAASR